MSLRIHPDPRERGGGYAYLALPAGTLGDATVSVLVQEVYGERWLAPSEAAGMPVDIGNPNWQSERFAFGPYAVIRDDDGERLRIGPEIVNKIEEYTPLRIVLGEAAFDVAWPDDVPPRAGAAVIGGIQAVSRLRAAAPVEQAVKPPTEDDPVDDDPAEEDIPDPAEIHQPEPEEARRNWLIPALLVLVTLIALGLAWYYLAPPDGSEVTAIEPVATQETCSFAALSTIKGGFPAVETAIRECGRGVSADASLRLIEEAAAQNDPGALLLFGTLYDGATLDPRIETLIGLSFDDDPARAAEYYARAAKTGSTTAQARLADVCAILSGSNATLAKGAYDDYCG